MNRYRSYGNLDDQPLSVGDNSFIGVDEYNAPENIKPGNVQQAVNHDFTSQDGNTRGGFVTYPETGANPFAATLTQETFTATLRTVNDGVYADGYYVMGATNIGGLDDRGYSGCGDDDVRATKFRREITRTGVAEGDCRILGTASEQ